MSREVAASIFCTVCGAVSASSVVSHTEPVHAPAAPIATAAAICLPVTIPPAASTGTSLPTAAIASNTSGTSTSVRTSPQWPPASVPCATIRSTPGGDLLDGVLLGADQRGDRDAVLSARLDHVVRRHAQRVGDQLDRVASATSSRSRPVSPDRRRAAETARERSGSMPWPLSSVGDEIAVLGGDPVGRAVGARGFSPLPSNLAGTMMSTPYGLPPTCSSIHDSSWSSCSGVYARRAEHAETARVGHRGDDVAAVAEGEEREVDAELLADR